MTLLSLPSSLTSRGQPRNAAEASSAPGNTLLLLLCYLPTRAQLLAHALVRRRVPRHVPLAAVRRDLALSALDVRPLLAPWIVADPSQLVAESLVLEPVRYGVGLAAVQRDPAPCAFVQGRAVLRLDLARRVLALSDISLKILRIFDYYGGLYLETEHDTR